MKVHRRCHIEDVTSVMKSYSYFRWVLLILMNV